MVAVRIREIGATLTLEAGRAGCDAAPKFPSAERGIKNAPSRNMRLSPADNVFVGFFFCPYLWFFVAPHLVPVPLRISGTQVAQKKHFANITLKELCGRIWGKYPTNLSELNSI